ncbi:hypothetical protein [Falsiroseomonas sp.]|uniref:hypothetical protein n=1 Tax=Falsiroseomonas sp. TaxID=2870721 RepID=UPI003F6EAB21
MSASQTQLDREQMLRQLAAHAELPAAWLATRTDEQLRQLHHQVQAQLAAYAAMGFVDEAQDQPTP